MEEDNVQKRLDEYHVKLASVDYSIHLPDSEYEVMAAVWKFTPPVTSRMLMEEMGKEKEWKLPTLISFLTRLENRGFLMSYKQGKERNYIPVADRNLYLYHATERFVRALHEGSAVKMLDSLYSEHELTQEDADAMIAWLSGKFGA